MNPTTSQEALAQLQGNQAQTQNPNDILASQRQQLGVQGAEDTVTGLRGAINKTTQLLKSVAPSVMGRTAGSLVTNAQAGKQIQNEQAPISQTLTDQGTQYDEANQSADKLEGQAEQAANGIYQGQQDKQSYLQNIYKSLYQREQSVQAAQQAEADRQEQIRQFNATLNQQKSQADRAFDLGNGGKPANDPYAAVDKQSATNAVVGFLKSNSPANVKASIDAITRSANNGNVRDKYKLELINQYKANSSYGNLIAQALGYKSNTGGLKVISSPAANASIRI